MPDTLVFDDRHRVAEMVAAELETSNNWGEFYAMGVARGETMVAGIVFTDIGRTNAACHIAVKSATRLLPALLDAAVDYAFRQLGLRRLTAAINADNVRSLRLNKRIGFSDEAILREAGSDGQDLVIRVLWRGNYTRNPRTETENEKQ